MQFVILAAFFLDAYAFSTEGVVGFTIGRRNEKSFLMCVKNSIYLSFFTALIISIFYLIFFKQVINIITDVEILDLFPINMQFGLLLFHRLHHFAINLMVYSSGLHKPKI